MIKGGLRAPQDEIPKHSHGAPGVNMSSPTVPSPQIGHWLFLQRLTKSGKHRAWTCRCTLCGHAVGCIDFAGTVVPFTGSLYRQRRAHDKKTHPDTLLEQKKAENALLGKQ
jgi:hypothetical protein